VENRLQAMQKIRYAREKSIIPSSLTPARESAVQIWYREFLEGFFGALKIQKYEQIHLGSERGTRTPDPRIMIPVL
jgi:hypothetical protein